jgi:hypothetical protein
MRMQAYGGPAQPSPLLGEALNAGFRYLEVKCAGCDTCNTVDLTTLRRPKENADLATGAPQRPLSPTTCVRPSWLLLHHGVQVPSRAILYDK